MIELAKHSGLRAEARSRRSLGHRFLLGLGLGLSLCLPGPASAFLDYEEDHLQLELVPGAVIEDINTDYETVSADIAGPLHLLRIGEGSNVWDLIADMEDDPRILWAEFSYLNETPEALRAMVVGVVGGTIEDYEDQEVYHRLRLDTLHQFAIGEGVTIAVLDTGVNADHPALAGRVLPGYDFVDNDDDPSDTSNGIDDDLDTLIDEAAGHGTMVAGIALLAAPGAMILPVRVINDDGVGRTFDVVKGILFAIDHDARVLNLSLGLRTPCEALRRGVDMAVKAGMIIVAAAGNDPIEDPPFFPASLSEVHGVSALDSTDVKTDFASYHPTVSVSGPGAGIRAPFLDDGWAIGEGSSFATPFVAGQAAVIAGIRPSVSKTQADALVREGVVDVYGIPGNAPYYGKLGTGRVDGLATWESLLALSDIEPGPSSTRAHSGLRIVAAPNPSPIASDVVLDLRGSDGSTVSDFRTASTWMVMDVTGRSVRTLLPRRSTDGRLTATWNGRDSAGRLLPSGLYFVRGTEGTTPTRVIRILE